jgi:RNA polymerase-binding transcription factor DksA
MSASVENIDRAKKFMDCMTKLLNFVECMTQFIPEGQYLEMMNLTKELYGFKPEQQITRAVFIERVQQTVTDVANNPIIQAQRRIADYKPKKYCNDKSDMEKLKTGKYVICERCDKIISKSYIKNHITNNICVRVDETKHLTRDTSKLNTTEYKKVIVLIRAWIHRADLRKIHMYRTALKFYENDLDKCREIENKLNKIAIKLN